MVREFSLQLVDLNSIPFWNLTKLSGFWGHMVPSHAQISRNGSSNDNSNSYANDFKNLSIASLLSSVQKSL